jgi:hypothetical protein
MLAGFDRVSAGFQALQRAKSMVHVIAAYLHVSPAVLRRAGAPWIGDHGGRTKKFYVLLICDFLIRLCGPHSWLALQNDLTGAQLSDFLSTITIPGCFAKRKKGGGGKKQP